MPLESAVIAPSDPAYSPGPFVNVDKYGAYGVGASVDETTRVQKALDNEQYVTLGRGPTLRTFRIEQVTLRDGHVLDGAGARIILPASSTSYSTGIINCSGGAAGGPRSLASDAAELANTITLTAGSVAALGLTVGDYLVIRDAATPKNHHVEVTGIAGEVITLMWPLPFAFTTANGSFVYRYTSASLKSPEIRNLYIDATLNTGADTIGVYLIDVLRPRLERITTIGCNYMGIQVWQAHAPSMEYLRFRDCGNASGGDMVVTYSSGIDAAHVHSEKSSSFGPTFSGCSVGTLSDFRISGPATRLFKLQNTAQFLGRGFYLNTSYASVTGLGVVIGSRRNIFHGVHIYGADEGLWVDGPYNEFWGVKIAASATRDIAFNSALCVDCLVQGDFSLTGLNDLGTGNRFIQTVG